MDTDGVRLTTHALERYRILYPTADYGDLEQAIGDGFAIDPRSAWAITGRNARGIPYKKGTTYIMHQDRTGLFAIDNSDRAVITFLRFEGYQQEKVLRIYPPEKVPPTPPPPSQILYPDSPKSTPTVVTKVVKPPPEEEVVATKPPTEEWQDLALIESLPHLEMPAREIRIAASLREKGRSAYKSARLDLWDARKTITPITACLCTVLYKGETRYLVRRPEFEVSGAPEWFLCATRPGTLPSVETRMAMMLKKRGWVVFPPHLE